MKRFITLAMCISVLVIGLVLTHPKVVFAASLAANSPPIALTHITVDDPGNVYESKPFVLQGTFKDEYGTSISGKHISFTLDGNSLGQAKTNAEGFFQLPVDRSISPGTHLVTATYPGERKLAPAKTTIYIQILPGTELKFKPDRQRTSWFVLHSYWNSYGSIQRQRYSQPDCFDQYGWKPSQQRYHG